MKLQFDYLGKIFFQYIVDKVYKIKYNFFLDFIFRVLLKWNEIEIKIFIIDYEFIISY